MPEWFRRCDFEFLQASEKLASYFGPESAPYDLRFLKDCLRLGITADATGPKVLTSFHVWASLPAIAKLRWWPGSLQTSTIIQATPILLDCGASGLVADSIGRTALTRAVEANNVGICRALLVTYTLIIDGLRELHATGENHPWLQVNTSSHGIQRKIRRYYKHEVVSSLCMAINDRKWDIVDVFVTSSIEVDMAPITSVVREYFLYALLGNIGPVLREFTRPTVQGPAEESDLAKDIDKRRFTWWPRRKRDIVREESSKDQSMQREETIEQPGNFQRPREPLQRFWQNDLLGNPFDKARTLVPAQSQPLLARLILENGFLDKINKAKQLRLHLSQSESSGTTGALLEAFTNLITGFVDLSRILALNSAYQWPDGLKDKLIKNLASLLMLQIEIQKTRVRSKPPPTDYGLSVLGKEAIESGQFSVLIDLIEL